MELGTGVVSHVRLDAQIYGCVLLWEQRNLDDVAQLADRGVAVWEDVLKEGVGGRWEWGKMFLKRE
jgi:hypothetical protein